MAIRMTKQSWSCQGKRSDESRCFGCDPADTRGAERFDVLQGIPTSESLYVQANAKAYLYRNKFTEIKGTKTYPITVSRTYTLRWTEYVSGPPDSEGNPTRVPVSRSDTQTVTKSYTVERKYSYWLIDRLEVYGLQKAEVSNYALPSGQVALQPNSYTPPRVSVSHDATHQAHIIDPVYQNVSLPGQTIQGGSSRPSVPNEDWTNAAEQAIGKIKVKNDSLIFNGQTIMDNRITEETAPTPREIPTPPEIGQKVLYSSGLMIDASKPNKADQPSSGTIFFTLIEGIGGGQNQSYPIDGINPVTVHTPVVNQLLYLTIRRIIKNAADRRESRAYSGSSIYGRHPNQWSASGYKGLRQSRLWQVYARQASMVSV